MIEIYVPAVPVAQPRQRHRVVKPSGGKAFATNYTPATDPVNAYKASVRAAAHEAYSGPPLEGPLRMGMVFVLPRTKPAWLTKKVFPGWWQAWKDGERIPHATSRNDLDNLMKSTLDSLSGLTYLDDGQLFAGPVSKWLAATDEQPHVEIGIWLEDNE